ncbi:hypothetical protein BD413DRAFT_36207 [Trametes elegans]|nr:hypothetical protein BD413DRAFT_36207 [Trametes elegans]
MQRCSVALHISDRPTRHQAICPSPRPACTRRHPATPGSARAWPVPALVSPTRRAARGSVDGSVIPAGATRTLGRTIRLSRTPRCRFRVRPWDCVTILARSETPPLENAGHQNRIASWRDERLACVRRRPWSS